MDRLAALLKQATQDFRKQGLIELEDGLIYFIDLDVMARWVQREQQG